MVVYHQISREGLAVYHLAPREGLIVYHIAPREGLVVYHLALREGLVVYHLAPRESLVVYNLTPREGLVVYLQVVEKDLLSGLSSLQELSLEQNKITIIHAHAFRNRSYQNTNLYNTVSFDLPFKEGFSRFTTVPFKPLTYHRR